jgi:voltage-gated potassium channel
MDMNRSWNVITAIPTLASLVIVLFAYLFPLNGIEKLVVYIFDVIVVILLVRDFYSRFKESQNKLKFILAHWYEFPAMIPLALLGSLPYDLSIIAFFRTVRLYNIVSQIGVSEIVLLGAFAAVTVIVGAFGIYITEATHTNANIKTPGDALWWSVETITTVAYGEFYPVTITGKIIATGVMFAAIGILWTLIPLLSSRFIAARLKQHQSGLLDETKEVIKNRIDEIEKLNEEDLERLISMLRTLNGRTVGK